MLRSEAAVAAGKSAAAMTGTFVLTIWLEVPLLIGPIFTRELVTAPRRPQHFLYRGVYGTALFVLMCTAWLVLVQTQLIRTVGDMAKFGSILFLVLAPLQLALITFLAALRSASSVAQEKDKKTILLLLMTRLTNHELVLGKLLASLLDVLVMLATAVPIFMLLTLFGGVSLLQVARVFAVTLATALAAGSLGSTVALAREKTFQSLAMTALILVIWIGAWEAAAVLAGDRLVAGVPLAEIAAAASPVRAILVAAHPFRDTQELFAAPDSWYVLVALAMTVLLNALAIARLRVWNPGRELMPRQPAEATTIWGEHEPTTEAPGTGEAELAVGSSAIGDSDEMARAGHVDARVRTIGQESRQVWDNPVLWREMCTWAYGRKVLVIKAVYLLLFAMAGLALYWMTQTGAVYARSGETILPPAAQPLAPFFLVSLVIVNALAVTSITNERDGGSLDLLLVTDLSPREFIFGKMLGVAYVTKEVLAAPLILSLGLYLAGGLTTENVILLILGLVVMDVFVITLGIHCGMNYANSRSAIGVSLGSVFFLFLGVVTLLLFMISFSGSFQTQLAPFLAFIVGGSVGLYVTLGMRNPSGAIGWASLLLPFATFFAITNFLVNHLLEAFIVIAFTYGFTTAAMLIPALYEFDIAMGRTKVAGEE
jgi:ABC-type transport system involved in multi-copper enzyme maturation permease subunit